MKHANSAKHTSEGRSPSPADDIYPLALLTRCLLRPFTLHRSMDITGVSGIGPVADGVVAPDGRAVLLWRHSRCGLKQGAIAIYESVEELLAVHGHAGSTQIHWGCPPPLSSSP